MDEEPIIADWPASWPGRVLVNLDFVGDPDDWLDCNMTGAEELLFHDDETERAEGFAEAYIASMVEFNYPLPTEFGGTEEQMRSTIAEDFRGFIREWRKRTIAERQKLAADDQTANALIAYCRTNDRVCPQPSLWDDLWKMLPAKEQSGAGWNPPLPLVLGAWHHAPNLEKMLRLDEHIRWAETHDALTETSAFLRGLAESDWHHLKD